MSLGRTLFVVALIGCGLAAAETRPSWFRHPAISPDGSAVVFSYRGDLYRVPASGGVAFPLTVDEAHDTEPVWSRDGSAIAFASDRYGNYDVFVMPSEGGRARRLTFHSADDHPTDFAPDGRSVIFTSQRLDAAASAQFPSGVLPELYRVGVDGGRVRQVDTLPAELARFDASGTRIAFQDRTGYEDPWRKHHTSSVTRDLWLRDLTSGAYTRLTDRPGEDRNPVLSQDGKSFYFLSERGGSFNVFRAPLDRPDAVEQVTRFGPHPIRFLSIAGDGTLCFGYHGGIWLLSPGGEPRRLSVDVRTDTRPERRTVSIDSRASEMAVSPGGKEIAFVVRGEVFVASVESGLTKRITDTPEQERSVAFSPDGRSLVYAGERGGSWNVYESRLTRESEDYFFNATVLEERPIVVSDHDAFQPTYSPDGKEVAYLEDRTRLRVIRLESRETRTILEADRNFSYADGDQYYQWSPDGKWFLVQFLKSGYWIPEVGLVASDGSGEPVNLTESGYFDFAPKWMMQGKLVTWTSNRDGLQAHAKTGPAEADVYGLFLTQEAWDRFRLTKEEAQLLADKEEEDDTEADTAENGDAPKKDKKKKKKKGGKEGEKTELPEVKIEMDGIRDRVARLTIHSSRLADAVVTPDGEKLLYLARFEKGYDLWQTELRTRETSILADLGVSGGALALDADGENVFVLAAGSLMRIAIESGEQKPIAFAADMNLDTAAERAYFFDHAWRQVQEKFYDRGLHGLDWDFLRAEYAALVPDVAHDADFADLLGEMLGELNASHTGARYSGSAEEADSTASLGLYLDEAWAGDGLRVAEVMARNPLVKAGSKLAAGVVIERIDGVAIGPDTNPWPLLNRKAGQYVLLSLHDPNTAKRWDETVKPLDRGEENELVYRRWVEARRRITTELSAGRVGYLHVRGMNDGSFRVVQEEVLGRLATSEAIVVDTRFNGGGDLVDDLSIFLSGRQYMDFIPPDGRSIGMEPSRRWTKPSVVLAGEGNYSDAHCFPWAYRELGIGSIVGMPVPGTCTFVWWEQLQNGQLVFGVPNMGIRGPDGRYLENLQLEPDIRVEPHPAELAAGRDAQLERAVEELLRTLNAR